MPHWDMWGFPKIKDTFWGVPIIGAIIYWGQNWGALILGNDHILFSRNVRLLRFQYRKKKKKNNFNLDAALLLTGSRGNQRTNINGHYGYSTNII